ncbi:MAG: DegT/DnrJ/EryC1/StrS family aminotransferase [Asticcacaulis sp.]|uniref:DegT/DnrJ/EryC1/StrS family aminotransferase n=1 Tax=Asticcacaulis sp. TaxID=1872648 RepID=UPI0025BB0AE4|nr:DegT/DnrJ/EryC1/StrS family aminotransferase [Asticcacaulis sp.]MCA1935016.1 DegT/DnrJ/EryC1/StrS family aminotransferase [Asticcacaulis sp.]
MDTGGGTLSSFDLWLKAFMAEPDFTYVKINHGFWERMVDVQRQMPWPVTPEEKQKADQLVGRTGQGFFEDGFIDELMDLIRDIQPDDTLSFGVSTEAWTDCARFSSTPGFPEACLRVMDETIPAHVRRADGLLLKRAVESGEFLRFLKGLSDHHVIVLGPDPLRDFLDFARLEHGCFLQIHPSLARTQRDEIETRLAEAVTAGLAGTRQVTVLLQAGSLAPYLILRLRKRFSGVRWVDAGLALSLCALESDVLPRSWASVHYERLVCTYNRWVGREAYPPRRRLALIDTQFKRLSEQLEDAAFPTGAKPSPKPAVIDFVENKSPDPEQIARFLSLSARANHWSNFGPVSSLLASALHEYAGLENSHLILPCANGTLALETLARLHEHKIGRPLHWCVPALSYFNVVRGYFAGSTVVDVDASARLSLDAVRNLPQDSYDGLVVTNPFGYFNDFSAYADFAAETGKLLLIDNAAGFSARPDTRAPYQAFSAHQTKPFGLGEGGFILAPAEDEEALRQLIFHRHNGYRPLDASINAKLSDIAAAYILDRLYQAPAWAPVYELQAQRIASLALQAGFEMLGPLPRRPLMGLPVLAPVDVPVERLENPHMVLRKVYAPLSAQAPGAHSLHRRLVNIPCHPGMARLERDLIIETLRSLSVPHTEMAS